MARYAVTGVASGIGAALAGLLKERGHQVVGFDVRETSDNVDQFIPLDLNDLPAIAKAAAQVEGPLDGLCNNAGLPPRTGLEAQILQVNFLGQRSFTQAMLPHLTQGSAIVNMASRAGHKWRENVDQIKRLGALRGSSDLAAFIDNEDINHVRAYDLSKEAMILWTMAETEGLFARDLRMISLSPGGVSTGILADFARAFGDRMAKNVARTGRPGNAIEVARVAAFALSPDSNWMKGEDIAIDGGMGAFNASDTLGLSALRLT
ncbi:SDR family oxidoreductase [Sulfitobacter aestuariivivens]|uniref:SDR family oxidoreductase n=1 Tax=Sulfitobacter aestuariivivens TaxID=2766981 RepID=A0A927D552_9RHOB|nr:SDR family oxidoreductase [Sulfitobacter aestuariivivens]MBD3665370.1 SDR family oxidoreductase [Sulfitobacter aestuariivivens]